MQGDIGNFFPYAWILGSNFLKYCMIPCLEKWPVLITPPHNPTRLWESSRIPTGFLPDFNNFFQKAFSYIFTFSSYWIPTGLQVNLNKIPKSACNASDIGFLLEYHTIYYYRCPELNWDHVTSNQGHVTTLWQSTWSVGLTCYISYLMCHLQNQIQHLPLPDMASSAAFPSHIGCDKTT